MTAGDGRATTRSLVRSLLRHHRNALLGVVAVLVALVLLALGANRPTNPLLSNVVDVGGASTAIVEGRLAIGGRCLHVLVANDDAKRQQGLQGRTELPFDGMLFVYDHDVHFDFTMSKTLIPLDASFYDARGHRVDLLHMTPCPTKGPTECPRYHSRHRYRYVVETGPHGAGSGPLGACPT